MKNEVLEKIGVKVKNLDNIIKFLPIIEIVDTYYLDNNIKILKFHNISITKLAEIKVLSLESSELERRITISKSKKFFADIIINPLTLLDITKFTLEKQKVSFFNRVIDVPYKEEKKTDFVNIVNTEEEFDEIINTCKLDYLEVKKQVPESSGNNTKVIFSNPIDILISEEFYEKFEELSRIVNNILQSIDFDLISHLSCVDDNIMKLIVYDRYSDFEILYKSLSYNCNLNQEETNKLIEVIKIFTTENNNYLVRNAA